jgi:hypothetical protein
MLIAVFTISMFVSATLLFLIEPMLAKMALPLLGGTPAVWNTCLVFFQAVLLAGYLYGYAAIKWLGRRTQIAIHIGLALAILAVLPPHIPAGWEPPTTSNPVLAILAMLFVTVGLPFFLLSSSTPILQRWFAQSGHQSAKDPYFLYAASNAGSLVGLMGYPFLLEPWLRLGAQSYLWSYCYAFFVVLTIACGILVWRANPSMPVSDLRPEQDADKAERSVAWRERLHWIALAFVPSSLMMGVTTALTTDVPAIPLFWVLPLALYLLSFVLVFASRPTISHEWLVRRLPFLVLITLWPTVSKTNLPYWAAFPLYLTVLFAVAMVCHGELARSRPPVGRLTEFYLLISVGGVLGGIFNSLIAPVVFSTVVEFPIALILAALLLRLSKPQEPVTKASNATARRNDLLAPLALGLSMAAVITIKSHIAIRQSRPLEVGFYILLFGCSMVWCLSFGKRPLRFAAGLVALAVAGSLYHGAYGEFLLKERSFFGVLRVANDPGGKLRYFFHGAIAHGIQSLDPSRSREPLGYYTKSGPAGSILRATQAKVYHGSAGEITPSRWGVIGLGAGAMACYMQPGESLTFFEIDPAVYRIAADRRYFTFLDQCAPTAKIVLGDARLKLRDMPDGGYDLLVVDAFSGDTIPMHLTTREALALYIRKLAPGGILAFHISNDHLELAPIFGALARDAGLVCLIDDDRLLTHEQFDQGKFASQWVVMARNRVDLGAMATDARWVPLDAPAGTQVWSDDYSNLLRIIKFNWSR